MVYSQFLVTLAALVQAQSRVQTCENHTTTSKLKWRRLQIILGFLSFLIKTFCTDNIDFETPLNLCKPTIWSPARSLENQAANNLSPNLSIFNPGSSASSSSSERRVRRELKDDPSKVFPVSLFT